MNKVIYIDRLSGKKLCEKVYKEEAMRLLYSDCRFRKLISSWLLPCLVRWPLFSRLYGHTQKFQRSSRKIAQFIETFEIDSSEFLEPIHHFHSFNDFFIRKLKPEARPITQDPSTAVIPADGRYYFYENIDQCSGFIVKGQKFDLKMLLQHPSLAKDYREGSMVIARLCPSDYHRFHFPCDCLPGPTELINGWLYSVHPWAIKKNLQILVQNKRTLCQLETSRFGKVLYMEIGATNVGSIQETYVPGIWQKKGNEKGYFEYGGSALIILFAKDTIKFDKDLLAATQEGIEIRCLLGQSMGKSQRVP